MANSNEPKKLHRIYLYPKDLAILRGRCDKTGKADYSTLRAILGKHNFQFITIREYCAYNNVSEAEVREALNI